ncbi:MAG TPA: AI-2E family transporter [Candidatus Fimadaptatus faecigallinarum]|uniref:AI-2E family transporter n=1 Tax=Candidatus Fimadaptatus faecigallinarum TaxID=2840814 RepID=A0A9D1S4M9_9FIRM|nr:AI-2E family transporter [Candidatus Fimadaptatus faecigallinarum]
MGKRNRPGTAARTAGMAAESGRDTQSTRGADASGPSRQHAAVGADERLTPDRLARSVFSRPLARSARDAGGVRFFWRVAPTLTFGIALYVLLENFGDVAGACGTVADALTPVFIGMVLAFILNIPMQLFETQVFFWIRKVSIRRGLSVLLCYLLLWAFVLTLLFVVFPQLSMALESLTSMLPLLGSQLYNTARGLVERYDLDQELLNYLEFDWNSIALNVIEWTTSSIPQLVSTTRDITSRLLEIFIGFVLSVYMLFGKERIVRQGRRLCCAVLKRDWAERVINLCSLAQTTFRGYLTGTLTEACILGTLTALGMAIFGFPSPVFAGVLMGIGALIPIFGIFIMVVVNAILIAVQADIFTGIWFIVYITVLQQLEGNLIYPRVMGNAIRLPGIWVLAAATVGGTLFGLMGLLLSIPTASMLYALARALVITREAHASQTAGSAPGGAREVQTPEYVDITARMDGDGERSGVLTGEVRITRRGAQNGDRQP